MLDEYIINEKLSTPVKSDKLNNDIIKNKVS